jgi:thiamine-monophosphate kinase
LRDERSIVERLRRSASIPAGSAIILGIGDDCAIYRPRGSADDMLFTSDLIVEGVHFLRGSHKPADLGRKALTRSLSDIAAMGGTPRFCQMALCVPPWAGARWVDAFLDGIVQLAAATGAVLAGGDLSQGDKLVCDVTVGGTVPRGTALRRDGARPGNHIYTSGWLGGSALGLETGRGRAWKRHLKPEARLALGEFLRKELRATSAIDLSDGLSQDLNRLCLASGVGAEITEPPAFAGATREQALHGGEDYELLFTVRRHAKVPAYFRELPLTRIGSIVNHDPGSSGAEVRLNGRLLPPNGYVRFFTISGAPMP